MRARRRSRADFVTAARADQTGQRHSHVLGPAQNTRTTRQRESAGVRGICERQLRTVVVPGGSDASGSISRLDRRSRANDATAARTRRLGAGVLLLLKNGIAFWAMKH
jgi:hypothetical protein